MVYYFRVIKIYAWNQIKSNQIKSNQIKSRTAVTITASIKAEALFTSKGKVIPITGRDWSWGFEEFEDPRIQDNRHMKLASLSVPRTGLLYHPGNVPGTHICCSSVSIATELRAGRSGIESRRGRDFPPFQTGPGAHPASCKMGTGSFPGIKCGQGVLLNTHPLLVPRSWKSRVIPLPTLWATPGL